MIHTSPNHYKLENGKVAILLATYNGEKYLPELLKSIVSQTFNDYCCFIHDDGSKDGTLQVVREYCGLYPDKFVLVDGETTRAAKSNFMYLLKCVEADYVMFCDQDDVWLPGKMEITRDAMKNAEEQEKPIVVYSDLKIVDSKLNTIDPSYYHYTMKNPMQNSLIDLLKTNVTVGCTMMMNKALSKKALGLTNIDNIFMHDWWLSLIAAAEGTLVYIDQQTILYRQHNDNTIGATRPQSFFEKAKKYFRLKEAVSQKKGYIQRPRLFCKELLNVINDDCQYKPFLKNYAEIGDKPKLYRIIFYKHWNLFNEKSNLLWQMLWV